MKDDLNKITKIALVSRVLTLSIAVISHGVVGSFDSSGSLQGAISQHPLHPLTFNWDAEYFTAITQHGYTFEQSHAFWPLLPYTVRILTYICQQTGIPLSTLQIMIPLLVTNLAFIFAARTLYK